MNRLTLALAPILLLIASLGSVATAGTAAASAAAPLHHSHHHHHAPLVVCAAPGTYTFPDTTFGGTFGEQGYPLENCAPETLTGYYLITQNNVYTYVDIIHNDEFHNAGLMLIHGVFRVLANNGSADHHEADINNFNPPLNVELPYSLTVTATSVKGCFGSTCQTLNLSAGDIPALGKNVVFYGEDSTWGNNQLVIS